MPKESELDEFSKTELWESTGLLEKQEKSPIDEENDGEKGELDTVRYG